MAKMEAPPDDVAPGDEKKNRFTDWKKPDDEFEKVSPEELDDVAPKRRRTTLRGGSAHTHAAKESRAKKPLPRWKDGQISTFCERVYKAAGGACLLNSDPEIRLIGQSLIECAYQAGQAWEKVAKRHEIVRRFFERIMTTSDLGELFWAHLPILVPVFRRFGPLRGTIDGLQEEFNREYADSEPAAA